MSLTDIRSVGGAQIVEEMLRSVEMINPKTNCVLRVFRSIKMAAVFLKFSRNGISRCCSKKQVMCSGFQFRFYDGPPLDCKLLFLKTINVVVCP